MARLLRPRHVGSSKGVPSVDDDPRKALVLVAEIRPGASGVAGEHRQKVWDSLVAIWPGFAEYQTKTARRIPLVRLKRVS